MDHEPDDQGRFGAALIFVSWAPGADKPQGHLETDYLSHAADPDAAVAPLLALPLQALKDHLERLIRESGARGLEP